MIIKIQLAFDKQKKLCFNCLLPNHQSTNCPLTSKCSVNGCGRRHTKFLHVIKSSPQHELPASVTLVTSNETEVGMTNPSTQHELPTSVASAANSTTLVESNGTGAGSSVRALPVLPVIVRNPDTMPCQTMAQLLHYAVQSWWQNWMFVVTQAC